MRTSGYHSYMKCITRLATQQPSLRANASNKLLSNKHVGILASLSNRHHLRWKSGKDDFSSLVIPVPLTPANSVDDINVGEELSTKINKDDILKLINKFYKEPEVKIAAGEAGLDSKLFHKAAISFRNFCMESEHLPVELHIVLSDILQGAGHITNILPYFIKHAKEIFPHLDCLDQLKDLADLREPSKWYPNARKLTRELIFHAGPTNSGKTYNALQEFMHSTSGVYCGPLKLLCVEVFDKTNNNDKPKVVCDLVTGEERKMGSIENKPANHVSCTIEMVSLETQYEVAVIDEIQMIKDPGRGWAWTRALLGINAKKIHICGEPSAINLVQEIAHSCGETLEVKHYERLTKLYEEDTALMDLKNIRPGDCIVCFSKNDIFKVSLELEKRGFECAVIYGGLPPGTKLAQAEKFNNPNHPCKILVATDAIGMGLNLSIRRIIFYSLTKPVLNEKGEKEIDTISTSQANQIAGRAGRFKTQFPEGYVTTFKNEDLPILKSIRSREVENIERAGLHPTAEKVEEFGYHLRDATLSNLIDIFISLCAVNTKSYFMCDMESMKMLAKMIESIPLPLRTRYVFCCAPINRRQPFVTTMFTKFAKQYSTNEPLTSAKLCKIIGWPISPPQNIRELVDQEAVFDVLDLYLWLSYRFPDLFPDVEAVRCIQEQLDKIIQQGVFNITRLLTVEPVAGDEDHPAYLTSGRRKQKSSLDSTDDLDPDNIMKFGRNKNYYSTGRVAQELLDQGKLTPDILKILHREWEQSLEESQNPFNPMKPRKLSKPQTKRNNKKK